MLGVRLLIKYVMSLVVVLSLAIAPVASAQTPVPAVEFEYYNETGHNVTAPFLDFFKKTGGVERYGYPLTDAFADPNNGGLWVQYFQKARLEWHPGNPDPYKIQLGLLGDQLSKREPPIPVTLIPPASDPTCYYFGETGHTVCHKFLDYWRTNGGLDQFGYPITESKLENGRIVQYFQRARLEWHPERPENQRIQLAALGQIYYDYAQLDRGRLQQDMPLAGQPRVISLRARGTVADAVIARNERQTARIWVGDQLDKPVAGAAVVLIVRLPTGNQQYTMPPTDANGFSAVSFPAGRFAAGTVIALQFIVSYNTLNVSTRTSYLLWFD